VSLVLRHRRLLFALLVVVVLAGIYEGAGVIHPAGGASHRAEVAAAGRSGRATVSTAVRACAEPGSGSPGTSSVAVTAMSGSASGGSAVVTPLTPGGGASPGAAITTIKQPGTLHFFRVPTAAPLTTAEKTGQPGSSAAVSTAAARGGVEVSASGAMAQGLEVEQTGPNGVVAAQCGTPGTDFWFLGPGQQSAGVIDLYLMNPGSTSADVQVSVLTDVTKGPPLLGNADNGITVPPHSMVEQSLVKLLQSSQVIALNVTTSSGQVVAAVRESRTASTYGSWLPATQAPAKKLVIPGLPSATGTRDLYVAVPGSASASVKITAVTPKGSYQPTGGTGIDLLGDSTTSIALPALSGVRGAITITSSVPVVAVLRVPGGPSGTAGAFAVSGAPIEEQGVLAANPAHSAGTTGLVLSAPGKAASVRITTATGSVSATGQSGRIVQIGARSSVLISAEPPAGSKADQFSIVVTPVSGSGPVYGGQVISSGKHVQSILPISSALTWIPLPAVQESLTGIVAGRDSG
jgi:Family of unknown function (DUF5719)